MWHAGIISASNVPFNARDKHPSILEFSEGKGEE